MQSRNDFPQQEKLEKLSNFLLNFDSKNEISSEFINDTLKQLGLLFHDMRRGINRASLIADFIVSLTKIIDRYENKPKQLELDLHQKECPTFHQFKTLEDLNAFVEANKSIKQDTFAS